MIRITAAEKSLRLGGSRAGLAKLVGARRTLPGWLSSLIEQLDKVKQVLFELRGLGIHIDIDDFGVGCSSLSYLQNLPIDGFKIDRSFVNEISNGGQQIVNTLVELGKNLKLTQVAEGVETQAQKEQTICFCRLRVSAVSAPLCRLRYTFMGSTCPA